MAKPVRVCTVNLRKLEDSFESAPRALDQTFEARRLTGEVTSRVPRRGLRPRQHLEGTEDFCRQLDPNPASVFHRTFLQVVAVYVISRECYDITDAKTSEAHQERHGERPQSLIGWFSDK